MKRLITCLALILALGASLGGCNSAHAGMRVDTCATAAAGASTCSPEAWADASSISASTMVYGCSNSTLAAGAAITNPGGGLFPCASKGGTPQWQPASFWASGSNLVYAVDTNTFVTLASAGYTGGTTATQSAPPLCPPYGLGAKGNALNAINSTTTVQNGWVDFFANPLDDPWGIVDWYCWDASANLFRGYAIYGYRSELDPNWAQIVNALKDAATTPANGMAAFIAAWKKYADTGKPDTELKPIADAQLAADQPIAATTSGAGMPAGAKTTAVTVYSVQYSKDVLALVPSGEAPIGTACVAHPAVNATGVQMYGVPVAAVTTWYSKPAILVVAPCQ
jgi:hypothetical protein